MTREIKTFLANGGKKKIGAHSASAGAGAVATIILINTIFGPLTGLADIPKLKDKSDTILTVAAQVNSMKEDVAFLKENMIKFMLSSGVYPTITQDTRPRGAIIRYFRVPRSDTTSSFWNGDTLMIPQRDSL